MKVLDFGLARRLPTEAPTEAPDGSTIPGRPLGTASYMAPERILQMPLDARCDLFSLGVVIYEMATGRLPFAAASPAETVTNILEKDPLPSRSCAGAVPSSWNGSWTSSSPSAPTIAFKPRASWNRSSSTFHDRPGNTLIQRVIGRVTKRP